jgi:hypothetical protein
MSLEIEKVSSEEPTKPLSYTPRTLLGEKLLAIREKILATGAPLLDQDEIEKEIAERRGEHYYKTI